MSSLTSVSPAPGMTNHNHNHNLCRRVPRELPREQLGSTMMDVEHMNVNVSVLRSLLENLVLY